MNSAENSRKEGDQSRTVFTQEVLESIEKAIGGRALQLNDGDGRGEVSIINNGKFSLLIIKYANGVEEFRYVLNSGSLDLILAMKVVKGVNANIEKGSVSVWHNPEEGFRAGYFSVSKEGVVVYFDDEKEDFEVLRGAGDSRKTNN